jgi:hypothetical protein
LTNFKEFDINFQHLPEEENKQQYSFERQLEKQILEFNPSVGFKD